MYSSNESGWKKIVKEENEKLETIEGEYSVARRKFREQKGRARYAEGKYSEARKSNTR